MVGKRGGEVTPMDENSQLVPDEVAQGFQTFQDALSYLESQGHGVVKSTDVLGDGFEVLQDKKRLIAVPFVIIDWDYVPGDMGRYVTVRLMTAENRKFRISDGSSGIYQQLEKLTEEKGMKSGLAVPGGLRESTFWIDKAGTPVNEDSPDRVKKVTTFYLTA